MSTVRACLHLQGISRPMSLRSLRYEARPLVVSDEVLPLNFPLFAKPLAPIGGNPNNSFYQYWLLSSMTREESGGN
jgi:hypothetical protein